jgi:hypothetical protein
MSRKQGKFVCVDPNFPSGAAICDRCGFVYNLRNLTWQYEWAGTHLYNERILVCTTGNRCADVPQEQFRTIVLPPDPPSLLNARTPDYDYEEQTSRITTFGLNTTTINELPPWGAGPNVLRCTQTGEQVRIIQYLTQSGHGHAPYIHNI